MFSLHVHELVCALPAVLSTKLCFHGSLVGASEFSVLLCIQQGELVVNVQKSVLTICYQVGITRCPSWAGAFLWMEPSAW